MAPDITTNPGCAHDSIGYVTHMSFVLVLLLIVIVAFGVLRLVRHDSRARPGSESHHRPAP